MICTCLSHPIENWRPNALTLTLRDSRKRTRNGKMSDKSYQCHFGQILKSDLYYMDVQFEVIIVKENEDVFL